MYADSARKNNRLYDENFSRLFLEITQGPTVS